MLHLNGQPPARTDQHTKDPVGAEAYFEASANLDQRPIVLGRSAYQSISRWVVSAFSSVCLLTASGDFIVLRKSSDPRVPRQVSHQRAMGKGNQEYYEDPCEHVVHMECTKHNFVQVATFDRRAKLARFVSRAYLRCPGDGIAHELLVSFNEALDRNCTPKQLQSLVDHFPKPGRVVHR